MIAALATGSTLALAGLILVIALGHAASDGTALARHVTLAVFVTLLTLLAHSMTLFYLIGKGRAVREALAQAGRSGGDSVGRLAVLRRPAFRTATMAMAATMAAAIVGGGVDTRVIPAFVHTTLGYAALLAQAAAVRAEMLALLRSAQVVEEVDRSLVS